MRIVVAPGPKYPNITRESGVLLWRSGTSGTSDISIVRYTQIQTARGAAPRHLNLSALVEFYRDRKVMAATAVPVPNKAEAKASAPASNNETSPEVVAHARLHVLLKELSARACESKELKCYYSGEFDGNQSEFEQLTTQGIIGVWAQDAFEASVLFTALRVIIDKNYDRVYKDYDSTNGFQSLDEIVLNEDEVSTRRNEPISKSRWHNDFIGNILASAMKITHAPVMFNLAGVRKLL